MKLSKIYFLGALLLLAMLSFSGCSSAAPIENTPASTEEIHPTSTLNSVPTLTATVTITPAPQPRLTPVSYGVELEDFPPN